MPKTKTTKSKSKPKSSSKAQSCLTGSKTCPILMGIGSLLLTVGSALFFWKKTHPNKKETPSKGKGKASKKSPRKSKK